MQHAKMNSWKSKQTFIYISLKLFDICKRRVMCFFSLLISYWSSLPILFYKFLLTTLRLSPLETIWSLNSVSARNAGIDFEPIIVSLNTLTSMKVFLTLKAQRETMEAHKDSSDICIRKNLAFVSQKQMIVMYVYY